MRIAAMYVIAALRKLVVVILLQQIFQEESRPGEFLNIFQLCQFTILTFSPLKVLMMVTISMISRGERDGAQTFCQSHGWIIVVSDFFAICIVV